MVYAVHTGSTAVIVQQYAPAVEPMTATSLTYNAVVHSGTEALASA
jgi:hypothetical protein